MSKKQMTGLGWIAIGAGMVLMLLVVLLIVGSVGGDKIRTQTQETWDRCGEEADGEYESCRRQGYSEEQCLDVFSFVFDECTGLNSPVPPAPSPILPYSSPTGSPKIDFSDLADPNIDFTDLDEPIDWSDLDPPNRF